MRDAKKNPKREEKGRSREHKTASESLLAKKRKEEATLKKRVRYLNKEYTFVSVFFVLIFLSLIFYVVYFNVEKSQEFINSPYNTRQNTFADRVVRGKIESSDGQTLAYTQVYEDGTEERRYPYSRIFSHVVGFDSNGKSGLESEANFQLLSSHSFLLRQIKNQLNGNKNMGDTVVSTLDYKIQNTAYQALGDRNGAVIAIEPSTGKILAMVSKPDFDPNTIESDWEYYINNSTSSNLLNRVTNGQYPPGSVFKIVTALDYIRENGKPDRFSYQCEGTVTKSDHTIRCYNGNVHGGENLYTAFANSCNTAFASAGVELGGLSLKETSEDLLFNSRLPYASAKKSVFSLDGNSPVPLIMQTAIGQGNTLVSPLHMALITASIANHGVLMVPHLIDSVKNDEDIVISKNKPQVYKRLMTNQEAALLSTLMEGVVTGGTASSLSGRSYSVAGKTGSAEFDSSGSSHSWFVGYCNVEKPDMVVAVIVENGGTGSAAAVPIAGQLFDAYYQSHAAEDTEDTDVDYSDYEDEDYSGSDNGWFDIVEEDYQEYHPEDYEEWDQIYEEGWDTVIPMPEPENPIDQEDPVDPDIPEVGDPEGGFEDSDWDIPEMPSGNGSESEYDPDYDSTYEESDLEWFPDEEQSQVDWGENRSSEEENLFDVQVEDSGQF